MTNFKWTIFKLARQEDGSYLPELSIDKSWIEKQRRYLVAETSPILIVFADVFAKYVYRCDFPIDMRSEYLNSIKKSLQANKNLIDVCFESDLITETWNIPDFIKACDSEIYNQDEIFTESIKRKSLYNYANYPISSKELFNISKKALACLKVEGLLEKRFSV